MPRKRTKGFSSPANEIIRIFPLSIISDAVLKIIPIEAGIGILLWIGIIIAAQAFQETPKHHALAVAMGLFPAFALWGLNMVDTGLRAAGTNLYNTVNSGSFQGIMPITGAISLSQGFIFTSMILAAMSVHVIERNYWKASLWSFSAALLSYFGIIHAYTLTMSGVANKFGLGAAGEFAICYAAVGILLLLLQVRSKWQNIH